MNKILLVLAHPALEQSRNNKKMITAGLSAKGDLLQIRDLYELYPRFNINVQKEQSFIEQSDIVIFQHPFYWYSIPALLKQYIDLVFTYGWAYGDKKAQLKDKILLNALTTNGTRESYRENQHNRFPLSSYLVPFDQLAFVCKMHYLPPFVLHESGKVSREVSLAHARKFKNLLQLLASREFNIAEFQKMEFLSDYNLSEQE